MPAAIVVGIDVGGPAKGFHAVALQQSRHLGQFASRDPAEVAAWCRQMRALIIGVDAPCKWSADGRARPAERELMRRKIGCFASTTRAAAIAHPKRYFHWMLNGEAIFQALAATHPLFQPGRGSPVTPACFETFPQAIACALAGKIVPARQKREVRKSILARAGVDPAPLTNIDKVDAALCAVAAARLADGDHVAYGDDATGHIIIPARPLAP